jgi:hypothetical protein
MNRAREGPRRSKDQADATDSRHRASGPVVSLEQGSQKAQVPALVRDLYSPQALYPGEDPALPEQLFLELTARFRPTDIMQWLLVGELWAITLDEIRYRRLLGMVLSPGELVQPEPSDAAVAESFEDEVTGICNDRGFYSLLRRGTRAAMERGGGGSHGAACGADGSRRDQRF